VTGHLKLDLEERLSGLPRGSGRADGSREERVALALLLRQPVLLGASGLRPGLLGLALQALGFPLLGALEHDDLPPDVAGTQRTERMAAEAGPAVPGSGGQSCSA
jgi:hypothetical protein